MNVLDYTKEGGVITITAEKTREYVSAVVKDTGIGMSQEDQDKLFMKFHWSKEARKMETDRSGLGLYIVKNIMEEHRGTVSVQSEVGKGTTVALHIPLHPFG